MHTLTRTVLFIFSLALTGCPTPTDDSDCEPVLQNQDGVYLLDLGCAEDDDEVISNDDDSAASDDDDDSAETDYYIATVTTNYVSGFAGPNQIILPRESSGLAPFNLRYHGEGTARAAGVSYALYANTEEGTFLGGELVTTHIETCTLTHVSQGEVATASPDGEGIVPFDYPFDLVDDEATAGSVLFTMGCETTDAEPEVEVWFMNTILPTPFIHVETGQEITNSILVNNGDPANPFSEFGLEPPLASTLTLSRAAGSPSGATVLSFQPLLRFHVCAHVGSGVILSNIKFDIEFSDEDETGWNSCGNIGNDSSFALYNFDDLANEISYSETFTSIYNGSCDVVPTAELGYVNMEIYDEIAEGTCSTYELWGDTSNASTVHDDTVQVNITDEEWLRWSDDDGTDHDGSDADGLPIVGGELVFR